MFDPIKTNPNPNNLPINPSPEPVEDILSGTDFGSASQSATRFSSANNSPSAIHTSTEDLNRINQDMVNAGLMPAEPKNNFMVEDSLSKNKTLFIVGIIGLIVIVLGIVGWIVYRKFYQSPKPVVVPVETQNENNISIEQPVVTQPTTTPAIIEPEPVIEPEPIAVDTDGDGLSDAEELTLGTNPRKLDTDADGLSDYDELKTFNTDPVKADTDADGYLDGEEVANGYNPNGPGLLE